MLLRGRQKIFVDKSILALLKYGNSLGVAPTGAGKTIMLSAVIGGLFGEGIRRACVLAHRDELTAQNSQKFSWVNPTISTSIFDASTKNWDGDVTFAMVQTLSHENNLGNMPVYDALIIDEAHHATASSYQKIIEKALHNNPKTLIYGVTATPNRGDKKGLRSTFTNIADQITYKELIDTGYLVRPRTFVKDIGVQAELSNVRKTMSDYDMNAVADIMNHRPLNDAVVEQWQEYASKRQTVVFCSTVKHAHDVCESFLSKGISAAVIWGDMGDVAREKSLNDYAKGDVQVIINVAVLTEGWDHPPTSCVILLRPSSYKSTMIQMIGRGLRVVDPSQYPNVVKDDCIILDFGTSTLMHGSLEEEAKLESEKDSKHAVYKECPECNAPVPNATKECGLCGYVWPVHEKIEPLFQETNFVMTEIELIEKSNFQWVDIQNDASFFMATGFEAWGCVIYKNGRWWAIGALGKDKPRMLISGERLMCFARADDWLNANEAQDAAHKSKHWLSLPPTPRQMNLLSLRHHHSEMTRYKASLLINEKINRKRIQDLLEAHSNNS